MPSSTKRSELTRFLRSRRAALSPESVGMKSFGPRRTPGLRREELAQLAGVSVTWYTWLEQGRDIQCSRALLDRLSRALRLSASDADYLFRVADQPPPPAKPGKRNEVENVQLILDGFTAGPALLMNPRLDVLAYNKIANRVFAIDNYDGEYAHNHLWRGFMDSARRAIYVEWEDLMQQGVALLRSHYAERIGATEFEELIARLCTDSPDFKRMWELRRTIPLDAITMRLRPGNKAPILTFTSTRLCLPLPSDHVTFFLTPGDERTRRWVRSAQR